MNLDKQNKYREFNLPNRSLSVKIPNELLQFGFDGSTLFKIDQQGTRHNFAEFNRGELKGVVSNDKNNSIGNGYRSLILSDFSAPYLFLKFNTKVWKFNYQNLFSKHVDYSRIINQPTVGDIKEDLSGIPHKNKYSAFHHLSINVLKNLNIGFFENIIFDRSDSTQSNSYDVSYLNPLIFLLIYHQTDQVHGYGILEMEF